MTNIDAKEIMTQIDTKIAELTKKADAAQMSGNTRAMQEYDKQIRMLQDEKYAWFKKIYSNFENEEGKGKKR